MRIIIIHDEYDAAYYWLFSSLQIVFSEPIFFVGIIARMVWN